MTLAELNELPSDVLDVRLAELVGWKILEPEVHPAITYQWARRPGDIYDENREILPRYSTSLDAVAEVRKTLHGKAHPKAITEQERTFRDNLCQVLKCAWYDSTQLLCAEPREITIALIATLQP